MQLAGSVALQLILGRSGKAERDIGFASRTGHKRTENLITYSGDGHLMTFAPTGAGKTSGPVICNALKHKGQLIVIDIKGEIHAATAEARRAMGQEVHVLDMRDVNPLPGSLNPLDLLILSGTDHSAIAHGFAAEIVERGEGEKDRFWNDWSETMIAGGLAWLLADSPPEKRTISQLYELFNNDDVNYTLATMLDNKEKVRDRSARAAFTSYLQVSGDITQSSIMASTQTHLRLFDSDMLRRLTDTSSMDVKALVAGEPMSLYIIVPPLRLRAYRPILRVWLSTLILAMTQRTHPPEERTLMLCDEMGNLGHVDALLSAATLMRSWGLTLWTFWQNVAQLQIYGTQATTLVDNAGVIQAFGARNLRMAQDFANIVGGISAEQIMKMKADEQLLLIEGKNVLCKQARYYSDELFKELKIS
jgi:type IV secretion system protein VirD4